MSATIGPAGGVVHHPSGAELTIPEGALAQTTVITLTGVAAPDPATLGAVPLGQAVEASPEGLVFAKPARLRLAFDASRVPAGTTIDHVAIRMAPHAANAFSVVRSEVDAASGIVSAEIAHFTTFVPSAEVNPIFALTPSTLPDGMVGQSYAQTLTATGGAPPYRWTVSAGSSLPPGLSLSSEGALQGTPSEPVLDTFFVTVTDSASTSVQAAFSLTVVPAANPVPVLTSMAPSQVAAGSTGTTITLTGMAFVPTSQVRWDGAPLATTYTSATQLSAAVPDALVANAGNHAVTVFTPAPGGGTSAPLTFSVVPLNPVPSMASVSPSSLPISTGATQITITGGSFVSTSSAAIGNTGIPTSFVSSTSLLATVPASYLGAAGTIMVDVFTPAPGGGYSPTAIPVAIGSPSNVPTLTSISPASATAGAPSTTVSLSGSGFIAGGVAWLGSSPLTTSVASSTAAEASIPASLLASATSLPLIFVNPQPNGGASGSVTFTIVAPDAGGGDAGLVPCTTACTTGTACYTSGPTSCGAISPGFCLWMLCKCTSPNTQTNCVGVHFAEDLGNVGSIAASGSCAQVGACAINTLGTVCTSGTDPSGAAVSSPCFNGGTDAFRQSTGVGYYKCETTGAGYAWTYLGSTYGACTP